MGMNVACLDLEGVLVPEIWIAFAEESGIPELKRTTRDEPDYEKLTTVKALQSCGFDTIATGDSFNDLAMIQASKAGFLFRSTEQIKKDYPDLPAYEEYSDLLAAFKAAL